MGKADVSSGACDDGRDQTQKGLITRRSSALYLQQVGILLNARSHPRGQNGLDVSRPGELGQIEIWVPIIV